MKLVLIHKNGKPLIEAEHAAITADGERGFKVRVVEDATIFKAKKHWMEEFLKGEHELESKGMWWIFTDVPDDQRATLEEIENFMKDA